MGGKLCHGSDRSVKTLFTLEHSGCHSYNGCTRLRIKPEWKNNLYWEKTTSFGLHIPKRNLQPLRISLSREDKRKWKDIKKWHEKAKYRTEDNRDTGWENVKKYNIIKSCGYQHTIFSIFCSSNGKSVTWGQNERSYRPNLWKRMSFHIKKKEAVEVNQTAIIKPFSKEDAPADSGSKEECEEPQVSQTLPCYPSQSPQTDVGAHSSKAKVCQREDSDKEAQILPTYVPEHPAGIRRRGGENSQAVGFVDDGDISIISVGDIGQTQGATIMDQISCVVNRFTANISELNTMMLPGGATVNSPCTGALPDGDPSQGAPQYLTPRSRQGPPTATTYAEVMAVPNFCDNPASKIYEHLAGTRVAGRRARDTEELMALTPPSPFRDSSLSSDGSSPPSISPASEADYDQLLLKHYSQSSSSL